MDSTTEAEGGRHQARGWNATLMAPEVLMGETAAIASDLYSVGLLGVYLLGGEVPHSKVDEDGLMQPFDRACIQRLGANSVKVVGRRGMEPVSGLFVTCLRTPCGARRMIDMIAQLLFEKL